MTGHGTTGTHHTAGPHSSDLANKADPRVDSDRGKLYSTRLFIIPFDLIVEQMGEVVPQVHMALLGRVRLVMEPLEPARQVTDLLERTIPLVLTLQTWAIKLTPASTAIWVC